MTEREAHDAERFVAFARDAAQSCNARALGTGDSLFEDLSAALGAMADFVEQLRGDQ